MGKISISQVLAELSNGQQCSLLYIHAQGKKHGDKKYIPNTIEGWNYAAFNSKTPVNHIRAKNKKVIGKQKTKGLIPIIDLDTNTQLTLFISHIIEYNGKKIIH